MSGNALLYRNGQHDLGMRLVAIYIVIDPIRGDEEW